MLVKFALAYSSDGINARRQKTFTNNKGLWWKTGGGDWKHVIPLIDDATSISFGIIKHQRKPQ